MDATIIAKKYAGELQNGQIKAQVLIKLPKLVTCNRWDKVIFKYSIDYHHDLPAVHYKGYLVMYDGGLYYLSQRIADELAKVNRKFVKKVDSVKVIKID